jgi:KDO2-lipid IV(A) lauroyltransferase
MQRIVYYLVLPFIYLLALIPYPFFYGFSDIMFFFLYVVFGYRKKVVMQNLRNSFPEKTEAELNKIMAAYYRYLCDITLETFKTLIITKQAALERCKMKPEAIVEFKKYFNKGRSVIIVMGHFGNWEWGGNTFSLTFKEQLYVIYHPLNNPLFNKLICDMRMRFGSKLIDMKNTFKDMVRNRAEVNATAFIADQTPHPENAHWTTFLNQDTPVFKGTEKIAQKMNYPIIYLTINRLKRGFYEMSAETLFDNPKDTAEGEITEAHTKRLEKDIIAQPEIWLWSHRRWKHKKPTAV